MNIEAKMQDNSETRPEGFYRRLGFEPTGDHYGHEIKLVCRLAARQEE
jgi:hypothetical protein